MEKFKVSLKLIFTDEYKLQFDNNNGQSIIKEVKELLGTYKGSMYRGYEIMGNDSIPDKDFIKLNGLILGSKENVILGVIINPEMKDDESIVAIRI